MPNAAPLFCPLAWCSVHIAVRGSKCECEWEASSHHHQGMKAESGANGRVFLRSQKAFALFFRTPPHCFLEDRLVARRFSRQFDRIFFCQMGPLLGVDPGLPFGLYFFPLTSEQLSIIYIKCQEHISEQFLFLLLFCFCWHWWSEGPICGTFLQESKSWSKLSPYRRFEGTSKTEIDQGFQKSWS